ncbi:MAG: YceI family protein [Chitinophagaceae bacterium]|nr:MAG: YceI family protein [Chitinophagaceae bacterium]
MKTILVAFTAFLFSGIAKAQSIYISKDAQVSFFSSAPIENIEANTNQAVSAINMNTGSVFFKVPIKSFQFERDLMQEHFNSDYLESDKYPYAEFQGKIEPIPSIAKDGTYPVNVAGQLTIHGVTKPYQGPGTIEVKNGQIIAISSFKVKLADHDIKIPRLLLKNIAEVVDVKVNAAYQPQKEAGDARSSKSSS